jgi:hypothetical protein
VDIQENERQFRPLILALAKTGVGEQEQENVMGNYMFMYEGEGLFGYKHSWTRVYVYVTEAGVLDTGSIDTKGYPLSPLQEQE